MQPRRKNSSAFAAIISLASVIGVTCVVTGEREARAQSAQAEALFQKGNQLMRRGRIAEACDAFAASNRLEPGAGVLLNLGACRERNGQLASALEAYKEAQRRAKSPKKREDADVKIDAIEPRISHLTVSISDDSRVEGLALTRNGDLLDPAQWNQALPVDGGDYAIAGSASGWESWQVVAHVPVEGGKVTVDVPRLKQMSQALASSTAVPQPREGAEVSTTARKLDASSTPGSLALPGVTSPEPTGHEPAPSTGIFTTTRKIAIGVAVASAGGVIAGVALGVSAKRKQDDAFDRCPDPTTPCLQAATAQSLIDSGRRRALEANIAFGVAAAAAIGAGVLWFTGAPDVESPRRVSVVPSVVGEAGIVVLGRF